MTSQLSTLRTRAYDNLRHRLLRGDFAVGERLLADDLADEIGISRTPVREALSQLAAESLVNLVPRAGWFVHLPGPQEQHDLFETRILIERYSATFAATMATGVERAQLQEMVRQQRREARRIHDDDSAALDPAVHQQWNEMDINFHRQILACCGNGLLLPIVDGAGLLTRIAIVSQAIIRQKIGAARVAESAERATIILEIRRVVRARLIAHHRIALGIRRRDAAAAEQAMVRHIEFSRSNARKFASSQQPGSLVMSESGVSTVSSFLPGKGEAYEFQTT